MYVCAQISDWTDWTVSDILEDSSMNLILLYRLPYKQEKKKPCKLNLCACVQFHINLHTTLLVNYSQFSVYWLAVINSFTVHS